MFEIRNACDFAVAVVQQVENVPNNKHSIGPLKIFSLLSFNISQ